MAFRFYSDIVARASRAFASGAFIIGLLLMGFGTIILALPEIFAFLAAGVFFLAGITCVVTAVKIFWAQTKIDGSNPDTPEEYRENVRIHGQGDRRD